MFFLQDMPTYESIRERLGRYPGLDAAALEAFLTMLRVASDVMVAWGQFLKTYRLSIGTFSVLMVLNRKPMLPQSPSRLAARCGVTKATMSGLIATLTRRRLIERVRGDGDGRYKSFRLTAQAIRLLDGDGETTGLARDYYARIGRLMAVASEPDLRRLTATLLDIDGGVGVFANRPSTRKGYRRVLNSTTATVVDGLDAGSGAGLK